MTSPWVWIVEDEDRQADFVERVLSLGFGHCVVRRFRDAGAVVDEIAAAANSRVDLLVLDLLLPAGTLAGTAHLPGLDLISTVRQRLGDDVGILVRTGFANQIPGTLLVGRTVVVTKGSSVRELVDTASSLLAPLGFAIRHEVEELPSGDVVGASPTWLNPFVLMSGVAIGASVWTATVLQVASDCRTSINRIIVVVSMVAGAAIGGARYLPARWRIPATVASVLTLLVATFVAPSRC